MSGADVAPGHGQSGSPSKWPLVLAALWLLGGIVCIRLDQGDWFARCQRPRSQYGDVGWSWWPPRTRCDWGDGQERDPGQWFWAIAYLAAVVPPFLIIGWWTARRGPKNVARIVLAATKRWTRFITEPGRR